MRRTFIRQGAGKTPAVALVDPKFGHNVSGALRNCAAFGCAQLWVTGERAIGDWEARGRLPREERMHDYGGVDVCLGDHFFDAFPPGTVPVAVELREQAEPLTHFEHPDNPLYVFGPEDGSLGRAILGRCHRFVVIRTAAGRCLNLAVAVGIVLHDRMAKLERAGLGQPARPGRRHDGDEPLRWPASAG
jgi:tRNA(Leu) C34 or U34 (ribose-2'-O)-methylase TrmL